MDIIVIFLKLVGIYIHTLIRYMKTHLIIFAGSDKNPEVSHSVTVWVIGAGIAISFC